MADDIEAFLRRAAQRRKEQAQRKAAPTPRPRPEYTDSRVERQSRQRQRDDIIIEAEVLDESDGLGQLSSRHLQGDHLAAVVGMADDNLDAHISKVFDHQVSKLAVQPAFDTSQALAEGDIAKTLISLLQSPQGLQQAFLLREIIDRPVHMWD